MSKKRMPNIELVRLIGCFMVICIHTVTWYTNSGELLKNSLLLRCFFSDGVPLFWYIMGYFLFINPNNTLGKRLTKTFTQLLIPAFGIMLFSQIWQDWVLADFGEINFLSCLDMHSLDLKNLFSNILNWNSGMTFGGHLWYVFTYLEVILWSPLLAFVCTEEKKATKCRRFLMLLSSLYIINRDVKNATVLMGITTSYSLKIFSVINPTLLFVLIGYEVYIHKDLINKHASWLRWCGLAGFVGFNLLKYFSSVGAMSVDPSKNYFIGISTVFGYLSALCMFIGVLAFKFNSESKVSDLIRHLSSTTLGIYIIHGVVYRKLNAVGVRDIFYSIMNKYPGSLIAEIISTLSYAVAIFIVCYIIIMVIRLTKTFLLFIYDKLIGLKPKSN